MGTTNATKQANVKAGRGGIVPPVDKRFGQPNGNPRHNGAWKKEDTARYKLEQMQSVITTPKPLVDLTQGEKK